MILAGPSHSWQTSKHNIDLLLVTSFFLPSTSSLICCASNILPIRFHIYSILINGSRGVTSHLSTNCKSQQWCKEGRDKTRIEWRQRTVAGDQLRGFYFNISDDENISGPSYGCLLLLWSQPWQSCQAVASRDSSHEFSGVGWRWWWWWWRPLEVEVEVLYSTGPLYRGRPYITVPAMRPG